ncbi:alpha/beta hydrolase [Psychrobacter sp. LV10R520-6]|uniref:alpha/beta hydrolase n=1 Tax=Psychrobacter sp. LV10R520-6 TaxID=1415574 RepID=UPI0024C9F886|nr:alpha/beta hydrolase [Psychrobacter sp. LV10R520-6]SNT69356.1 acetyl esterase [Psychrobacter sp. LV10R520-6]
MTIFRTLATSVAILAMPALSFAHDTSVPNTNIPTVVLEKTTQQFIDSLKGTTPINQLPYAKARQVLIDTQTKGVTAMPPADVQEMTFKVGMDGEFKVYTVRPVGTKGKALPGVVYFHGGGWVLGNFTTHERLMRDLATQANAAMVFVEYSPAPEKKHPVQLNQAYAVLKYVSENAATFGIDANQLSIAGDSVGGQMVAVSAVRAKAEGLPLDSMVMFYPVTTADLTSNSYKLFADGPWLSKASMQWFWNAYLPKGVDSTNPRVSPLNYSQKDLANLPPALVITDANDVLRDEGEAFASKLTLAGVKTQSTRYDFTTHDFVMLNPYAQTPATTTAITEAANFLKNNFTK